MAESKCEECGFDYKAYRHRLGCTRPDAKDEEIAALKAALTELLDASGDAIELIRAGHAGQAEAVLRDANGPAIQLLGKTV